jgi:hypothetical protein
MSRLALILPLVALSSACGSKPDSSDDESSTSTTDASTTTTTSTSTTIDPSTSADSTTTEVAESSESGPSTLTVSGVVTDFFAMGPIGFAQISLLDEEGSETVSNSDGTYAIEGLEAGSFHRIRLDGNVNYWGAIVPVQLEDESIDDNDLSQVSTDVIDLQAEALQQQEPTVVVDENAAVLLVAINQNTATGATVIIDPPPLPNTYYAPDADGAPILNQNVIEWGLFPVAIFFNLPPGEEGTYSIEVTHPDRECTVQDPQPPTLERHINLVYVDCI